ncbi:hypothetical protein CC2G_004237 [Coprinopsis cinerea AmutBmut pab1-1]|nr:hypothetical protein CC2G_004237 [Coprinopsis cinerea AmutBmut pab1-1]
MRTADLLNPKYPRVTFDLTEHPNNQTTHFDTVDEKTFNRPLRHNLDTKTKTQDSQGPLGS